MFKIMNEFQHSVVNKSSFSNLNNITFDSISLTSTHITSDSIGRGGTENVTKITSF